MKITKMGIDLEIIAQMKEAERIEKLDCDKCPCCGETKTADDYYFNDNIHGKGVDEDCSTRKWVGRRKNKKLYETTFYKCYTCGTRWESEPYEVLREW